MVSQKDRIPISGNDPHSTLRYKNQITQKAKPVIRRM